MKDKIKEILEVNIEADWYGQEVEDITGFEESAKKIFDLFQETNKEIIKEIEGMIKYVTEFKLESAFGSQLTIKKVLDIMTVLQINDLTKILTKLK